MAKSKMAKGFWEPSDRKLTAEEGVPCCPKCLYSSPWARRCRLLPLTQHSDQFYCQATPGATKKKKVYRLGIVGPYFHISCIEVCDSSSRSRNHFFRPSKPQEIKQVPCGVSSSNMFELDSARIFGSCASPKPSARPGDQRHRHQLMASDGVPPVVSSRAAAPHFSGEAKVQRPRVWSSGRHQWEQFTSKLQIYSV